MSNKDSSPRIEPTVTASDTRRMSQELRIGLLKAFGVLLLVSTLLCVLRLVALAYFGERLAQNGNSQPVAMVLVHALLASSLPLIRLAGGDRAAEKVAPLVLVMWVICTGLLWSGLLSMSKQAMLSDGVDASLAGAVFLVVTSLLAVSLLRRVTRGQ